MPPYFFTAILCALCLRCVWRFATLRADMKGHAILYILAAIMLAHSAVLLATIKL